MKTVSSPKTNSLLAETGLLKSFDGASYIIQSPDITRDTMLITFADGKTISLTIEDFDDFHRKREDAIKSGLRMGMRLKVLTGRPNELMYMRKWLESLKKVRDDVSDKTAMVKV